MSGALDTAAHAGAGIVEVEVICSDRVEHRGRVESRASDVDGLVKPTWTEVIEREYEPWVRSPLRIDSAFTPVAHAVQQIVATVRAVREAPTHATD
jgi:hypothetical protein